MSKKPSHYSMAKMLWNTLAYCNQWEEVLAVYDENGILRIIVAKDDQAKAYDVALIGSWDKVLYRFWGGISLRNMRKSMESCFKLYRALVNRRMPTFVACEQNKTKKKVPEILTHTRSEVIRKGSFKAVEDAFEETLIAKKYLQVAKEEMEPIELLYNHSSDIFYEKK